MKTAALIGTMVFGAIAVVLFIVWAARRAGAGAPANPGLLRSAVVAAVAAAVCGVGVAFLPE